jgi:hypothetical protein
MKTTIITLGALVATLITFLAAGSLALNTKPAIHTSAQLGAKVVASLQESSFAQYEQLFPSLEEFKNLMEENAHVYGNNLKAAQADFANEYHTKLVPVLKESFDKLQRDGKEKEIDWSAVKYVTTSYQVAKDDHTKASITVVVSSNGKEYQITIQNILVINGQWRIGQFAKLS